MLKSNGPVPMDNVQESPMSHNVNDLTVTDRDTEGTTSGMDDCDEATLQNQQSRMIGEIEALVKQQPLTSDKFLLSCLQEQYKNNTNFISGLTQLHETYRHIRIIRGDGNCYYRAFLYSLLEQLACEKSNVKRKEIGSQVMEYVETKSWDDILSQGYDEMAIEIFHDEIVSIFHSILMDDIPNDYLVSFHQRMNEENSLSDYCTWYLRLVTATYIKQDPDRFLPFLVSYSNQTSDCILDINQFCSKFIEPMEQECEHIQVLALAEAFGVSVRVEYLDGHVAPESHTNGKTNVSSVTYHQFGPENTPLQIVLLYRPGHYDILYKDSVLTFSS